MIAVGDVEVDVAQYPAAAADSGKDFSRLFRSIRGIVFSIGFESFAAQRDHRIDPRGAPCGQQRGEQRGNRHCKESTGEQ